MVVTYFPPEYMSRLLHLENNQRLSAVLKVEFEQYSDYYFLSFSDSESLLRKTFGHNCKRCGDYFDFLYLQWVSDTDTLNGFLLKKPPYGKRYKFLRVKN